MDAERIKHFAAALIGFLFAGSQMVYAQVDTLWTKTYGGNGYDVAYSVIQTSDEGFVLTGYTGSFGAGLSDVWLIRTNNSGDTLWTKTFGGEGDDFGYAVQQTLDGGFIINGYTDSFGAGLYDIWLLKTDASGDTLWTKTFGGGYDDFGMAVQQTADEGYIITGYTDPSGEDKYDVWLIKTDASGDTIWTKRFGADGDEKSFSVQQTDDEGYILTGYTTSFGAGSADFWLIKTDDNGDTLWTRTFGGKYDDWGYSVRQTFDKGYIITGFTMSFGAGLQDVWLIKTDSSGDTLWTKTYGANGEENGYSVQQTSDEGYIITGFKRILGINNTNVWLIKTDASGDVLWTKTFGGNKNDAGYWIEQTTGGGYIITGYTIPSGSSAEDVWLIRTTSDLNPVEQENSEFHFAATLTQNYPNPFNPSTTIDFEIPVSGYVSLKVFNIMGQEVATLVNKQLSPGTHKVTWNAAGFASGVYFYHLESKGFVAIKKLILLK